MTVRQILEEAKRLEPIERAELLEQLYATFEPADPSVDAAWSNRGGSSSDAGVFLISEGRGSDQVNWRGRMAAGSNPGKSSPVQALAESRYVDVAV